MMNESIIVRFMDEANKRKQRANELYKSARNAGDRHFYRELYLRALELYSARYQTVLALGYDVVSDENGNIIGIEKI